MRELPPWCATEEAFAVWAWAAGFDETDETFEQFLEETE